MMSIFKNIKVLIWDFDKTFYPPNPALEKVIRDAEFNVISQHTGWNIKKSETEFHELYRKKYFSAGKTVSVLCQTSIVQVNQEMEMLFDRRKYLKKDLKLIQLFQNLQHFQHFILANGVKQKIISTLIFLGLKPQIFTEIVTPDLTGVTKPDEDGFKYILKQTNLPSQDHLMIGDRVEVDLLPAKKLGMKTCLVWSLAKSSNVDITIKDIYSLENLLL